MHLERVSEAEQVLIAAATKLPVELKSRLDSDKPLSDEDKKTIIALASSLLARFSEEDEPLPKADAGLPATP